MWERSVITRRHLAVGLQPVGQGPPPHDDEPARSSGGTWWAAGCGPGARTGRPSTEGTARMVLRFLQVHTARGRGRTLRALMRGKSAPLREQAGFGPIARNKSRERTRSTRLMERQMCGSFWAALLMREGVFGDAERSGDETDQLGLARPVGRCDPEVRGHGSQRLEGCATQQRDKPHRLCKKLDDAERTDHRRLKSASRS